jgi:PIN domain nuclease of toxin-antitoxin system
VSRYLLDTHALIWWWRDDARLSERARGVMRDRNQMIYVPSISALEIANKVRIGKLPEMASFVPRLGDLVAADAFRHLSLTHDHALRAGMLPGRHGDPFDRMIAAQALIEDMTVITCDREIAAFGCKVLW